MSIRTTILLAVLLVALAVLGLSYWKGGGEPRAQVRELKADAKATKASTAISRDTAEKVEVQGAETRERTAPHRRRSVNASRPILALLLVLTLTSCASLGKPTTERFVPPAGCSERVIALRPPMPPDSDDYRRWAEAYTGAVGAYEDSETKRAETADCLDKHRSGK